MTSTQFGFEVEDLFAQECKARGIVLFKPARPMAWDFATVVDDRLVLIQVKATEALMRVAKKNRAFRVRCYRNTRPPTSYHHAGVDYIAAYVVPFKRWHIFPAPRGLSKVQITRNPVGKQKLTIDRWDLFGAKSGQ